MRVKKEQKNSKLVSSVLVCFCLIAGFTIAVQGKGGSGQQSYASFQSIADYETTIASEQKEIERLQVLITETETKVEEYEGLYNERETLIDRMLEELLYTQLAAGATDVSGEGIEIYLDDGTGSLMPGQDLNMLLVHDQDVLILVNDLKQAGAEAISINGQRLIDMTHIKCNGYTIRVNGQVFARPYVIKAIGDPQRMSGILLAPEGYGTILQSDGLVFRLELKEEMVIERYSEPITYRYAVKDEGDL